MSNAVGMAIIFLFFLLIIAFWYQITGISVEESMVMTAILIMLSVLGAGLFGNVKYSYIILVIFAAVGLFAFPANIGARRHKQMCLKARIAGFFSPSLIIIAGVFLYAFIFFRKGLYTYPDEVYQWGNSLKYMAESGRLPFGSEFTGASITLSACTMFQYFWVGLFPFVESNSFVGNFLLTFIPVMLLMKNVSWKEWKTVLLYAVSIFFAMNLFSYVKYYTLLQDWVLPMWTGSIVAWLLWRCEKKINWILLISSLVCIGAMKSLVGPLFGLMIFLVAAVKSLVENGFTEKPLQTIKTMAHKGYIFLGIAGIVAVFSINIIWSSVLRDNVLSRGGNISGKSPGNILSLMIKKIYVTLGNSDGGAPFFSYVIFAVVFAAGFYFLRGMIKDISQKKIMTVVFSLYLFGFVGYFFIMYYAYLNIFGVGDSRNVAGLERYLSYYMLVGLVPLIAPLFCKDIAVKNRKLLKNVCVGILVFCMFGTGNGFISKATTINRKEESSWKLRTKVSKEIQKLNKLVDTDGPILVVGKLKENTVKMYTYELGTQYRWDKDSYTVYNKESGTRTILDVVQNPELVEDEGYEYIWFIDPEEENNEYYKLKDTYGLKSIENGDLYKLISKSEGSESVYLGNTK